MVAFANPVLGVIHPKEWVRPSGNTDFKVTKDAAAHMAVIRADGKPSPPAIDIGDGDPDHDAVLAMAAAKVIEVRTGDGTVNTLTADGYVIGYTHMLLPHLVVVGQTLTVGQLVGHVSNTYPDPTVILAAHLHLQIGKKRADGSIEWLDPWPLLSQNQEAFVLGQLESFNPPRKFTLLGGTAAVPVVIAGYSIDLTTGAVKQVKTTSWTKDSSGDALAALSLGGKKYLQMPVGAYLGPYIIDDELHIKLGPVVDPTPYSQADLDAVKKQLDSANNKIAKAKADLA